MKSLWNQTEADKYKNDPVEMRAYTSRLLGTNSDLVLHGGGNTSVKVTDKNIFGEEEERLYVKGSGHDLKTIQRNGFAPTRLDYLKKLAGLSQLSDTDMMREMKISQTDPAAPTPSVEAILHAIIPFKYVDHTHTDAVVAISNSKNGPEMIRELYPERVLILDYTMPGFILSKQVYEATLDLSWDDYDAIVLLHHGVFTFSDDPKVAYENMIDVCNRAEEYIEKKGAMDAMNLKKAENIRAVELASLRREVSLLAGKPFLASLRSDERRCGYASLTKVSDFGRRGPITPDHVLHTKRIPMMISENFSEDVSSYAKEYKEYFERNKTEDLTCLDLAPRYALWPNKGIAHFAPNAKRLTVVEDIIGHTLKAVQWGEKLGGWEALDEKNIFDLEYWELEQAKLKRGGSAPELEGKVALVTGAASGIGRAAVNDLMNRGAAVVALDVNPEVETLSSARNFIGIICDVTSTEKIKVALEKAVKKFGGLDILVSNAGSFPKSVTIEDTEDNFWDSSLNLNLGSHFRVIREAVPYLKLGFDPSVIFVGSKNVAAPGPGVASYSVSKAGLTQLARVAALELGKYGIRVNVLHPNAVFDTGIWDESTLEKRAQNYGLSVEEYKRNNVLGEEVKSTDVANLVSILAGNSFSKITGAQIPIDGGNERVI